MEKTGIHIAIKNGNSFPALPCPTARQLFLVRLLLLVCMYVCMCVYIFTLVRTRAANSDLMCIITSLIRYGRSLYSLLVGVRSLPSSVESVGLHRQHNMQHCEDHRDIYAHHLEAKPFCLAAPAEDIQVGEVCIVP